MSRSDVTTRQRSVLVLGTNAGQADLIRHMSARGWYVIACAHRANGPGEALADRFELIDITDVAAVTRLAREANVELVYSISSDIGMTSAVEVSEALGTPHFFTSDLIALFNNKQRLRSRLNEVGLSVVAYREVQVGDDMSDWDIFPCIVKPANAQGQRGVQRIERSESLAEAIKYSASASHLNSTVIVEQFLPGVEISCNVLVRDDVVVVDELSERLVNRGERIGIPKGHLIPCYNVSEDDQKAALKLVRDVISLFEIRNGSLYFQMKVTPEGPRIIEIAPRLDGCHIWRLMAHSCGIDYLEATVDCLLDAPRQFSRRAPREGWTYELMFQQSAPGDSFSHAAFPVPSDVLYHEYRYHEGEKVLPVNGRFEVVGYYVRPVGPEEAQKYLSEVEI